MSLLKTYEIAAVKISLLNGQISPLITNYQGSSFYDGVLSVYGDSIIDENALDAAVAAHNPNAVEVPESITPRQARQILFINGFTDAQIVALFNQMPSPQKELALIEWEYSTAFIRSNPLITQMGAALGLTPTQIDQMFIDGAQL